MEREMTDRQREREREMTDREMKIQSMERQKSCQVDESNNNDSWDRILLKEYRKRELNVNIEIIINYLNININIVQKIDGVEQMQIDSLHD